MNIGIDCRALVGQRTGIGNYLWEILNSWAELGIQHELYLYSPREFSLPEALVRKGVRFRKRIMPLRPSELWLHTVLPFQMAKDHIQLYWGPNYAQPYFPVPIPSVLTIHDLVYRKYPDTMKNRTLWHNRAGLESYLRFAQLVFTPSEHTRQDVVRELMYPEDKVIVTPLGVSNRFQSEMGLSLAVGASHSVDSPYILTVGTLEPRKNLNGVISAFMRVKSKFRNLKLYVVGAKGWGGVSESIHDVNDDGIEFLGFVDDQTLVKLYHNAEVFVYVPWYEGFGLPPLEAMMAGTPVVVSKTSSLPEVVGASGLYADPGDVQSIADAILHILGDDKLRMRLRQAGLKRAESMTWKQTATVTLQALEHIAEVGEW